MSPYASDFLPGSLEYVDKAIEVADGFTALATQKGTVIIKVLSDLQEEINLHLEEVLLVLQ